MFISKDRVHRQMTSLTSGKRKVLVIHGYLWEMQAIRQSQKDLMDFMDFIPGTDNPADNGPYDNL